MKNEEIEEIVITECSKHRNCDDNGVCPYYIPYRCLMMVVPENHFVKPKMTDEMLYDAIQDLCCVNGCDKCVFSQHEKIHALGLGCMGRELKDYNDFSKMVI